MKNSHNYKGPDSAAQCSELVVIVASWFCETVHFLSSIQALVWLVGTVLVGTALLGPC